MIIILVRHGERGMMSDALTPKGIQQAKNAAKRMAEPPWSVSSPVIYHSPKERCVQTAQEISEILNGELRLAEQVDECRSDETSPRFFRRASDFLVEMKAQHEGETIVVVSHSDWLEAAAEDLLQGRPALSWLQGSAHVVEIVKGKAEYRARLG